MFTYSSMGTSPSISKIDLVVRSGAGGKRVELTKAYLGGYYGKVTLFSSTCGEELSCDTSLSREEAARLQTLLEPPVFQANTNREMDHLRLTEDCVSVQYDRTDGEHYSAEGYVRLNQECVAAIEAIADRSLRAQR